MNNFIPLFIRLSPILLIALNLILKLLFIETNSIGGDEPFSIYHAQMDITTIISELSRGNNPPLYEIILHYWIQLFGISEISVRMPSLLFSLITAHFVFKIGLKFYNPKIAITATLLCIFSNYLLTYAHEARVYGLFSMLSTLSMYYFLSICNNEKNIKTYFALLMVNIFMIYSHYFGFYIIVIQTISVLCIPNLRKAILPKYFLYIFSMLLLYIPNLMIFYHRMMYSTSHGTWIQAPTSIESLYNIILKFSNQPLIATMGIAIFVMALIKMIKIEDYKKTNIPSRIITIWFLFPLLFIFIISFWIPMFLDRYLIFTASAFYLLLTICTFYLINEGRHTLLLPSILIALFACTFNPDIDNKRHAKQAIEAIRISKDSNTIVLICPQHFIYNFAYYFDKEIFKKTNRHNAIGNPTEAINKELVKQRIYSINQIDEVEFNGADRIIYLDAAADFSSPNNRILPALNTSFTLISKKNFYEIFNVYEYSKK